MKVAIFESEDWEEAAFRHHLVGHDLRCTSLALDPSTAPPYADCEVISTSMLSGLNALVLRLFPALRLIVTRSVGFDHIDLEYCRTHDVTVCNIPDYGDFTVAEHAFALLLAVNRRIITAVERYRDGIFDQKDLRGTELRGKTLGVIGTGRIGRRAIEIAKGFGMKIVAYDLRPNDLAAQSLGFSYLTLIELLRVADVVTLHIPGAANAQPLLSDREFAQMKRGVVLINTARGSLIDTEALLRALGSGQVSAAGLDVLPQEPEMRDEAQIFRSRTDAGVNFRGLVADHVLLHYPNVVVTPHNAYNTSEAMRRIVDSTISIIDAFAHGAPRNIVHAMAS